MSFLLEKDALNGKSGKAIFTKDGRNHELFGAKKIQAEMTYPGQVKITVIRETRSVSYAK